MILLIDNYDSFTYNLVQRIGEIEPALDVRVFRNDKITVAQAQALDPSHVIISPGPCTPNEGGISNDIIQTFAGKKPLLGVCLGHQCIGQAFGGRIVSAKTLMHGKTSRIHHDGRGVFTGLPQGLIATRYHSLVVERATLPDELEVSAWTDDDEIMGLRHREHDVEGVQFHPESILTTEGKPLLANFLSICEGGSERRGAA